MSQLKCIICFNQLVISESNIYSTTCGHVYHYTCISDWIQKAGECPQCRKAASVTNLHQIFLNVNTDEDGAAGDMITSRILSQMVTGTQFEELKSMIETMTISMTSFEFRNQKIGEESCELKAQIEGMQSEINDQNIQIATLKDKLEIESAMKSTLQNDIPAYEGQIREQVAKIFEQHEQIKMLTREVREVNREDSVSSIMTENQGNLANKTIELDDQQDIIISLRAEIKKLRDNAKQNENTINLVFEDFNSKKNMKPKERVKTDTVELNLRFED